MTRSPRSRQTTARKGWLRPAAVFLLGACAATPGIARAGDGEELEAAKSRMNAGNYAEAEERLRRMLDKGVDPCPASAELTPNGCRLTDSEIIQKARGYYAIALVGNGKKEDARPPIDDILLQDPYFNPSPSIFPQPVMDLFIEERGRKASEIQKVIADRNAKAAQIEAANQQREKDRKAYIDALEAQASVELETERRSRWIAAIPLGVGQYQNGDIGLGLLFTVSEVLAGGTMIVTTAVTLDLEHKAIAFQNQTNFHTWLTKAKGIDSSFAKIFAVDGTAIDPAVTQQLQALQIANGVSFGVLIAMAVSGVIEAEASFKQPAPTKKTRPLPPKPPSLQVTGVPNAPGSTGLGLKLTF